VERRLSRRRLSKTTLTVSIDLQPNNIAFTLPDLNSWTVDGIYEVLGKPLQVPRHEMPYGPICEFEGCEDGHSQSPTSHSCRLPRHLVEPPAVSDLWGLCTAASHSLPSIRILDFTESFQTPFHPDYHLPGTPICFAAPELLLSFPSEITTSIDIWAFACIAYQLFVKQELFQCIFGTRSEHLAYMIVVLGGKDRMPEQAFWEKTSDGL
jgi:serine/threonine protein kinase